jgi:hypothetical protein
MGFGVRSTWIFHVRLHRSRVITVICDLLGREVKRLIDEIQDAGTYDIIWHGTDESGHPVSSGVYFTRLVVENFAEMHKLTILR